MTSPKEHIDAIRKTKYSIGGEPNPLTEDLHQAVRNLSAELYTKDVHFLMELIQVLFHVPFTHFFFFPFNKILFPVIYENFLICQCKIYTQTFT